MEAARPEGETSLLVGREREQALLGKQLAAALGGHGALVLIGGEAGLGKTALAEALLAEAAGRGALVLVGRCYDLSETPPYGPWREVFARAPEGGALPTLPVALLPAERRGDTLASGEAIVARAQAYLAALAARQPVALLLDDLQWADPASLDLLRAVGRGLGDLPLLLLATYRADDLPRQGPLYRLLPTLVREARATRLAPRPLDADDLRALARRRHALLPADEDRLVVYLAARSEGNPFFAGELLRALEEAGALRQPRGAPKVDGDSALGELASVRVPPLLRQVLDARLDRLGEDDRGLLAIAAVIGQEVPLALWAAVALHDEEAVVATVGRAVEAGLLRADDDGLRARFAHALIREALYEGLLPPRRRIWHRRTAEALLAAPHPDPEPVAHHLRWAGDPRAAEWLIRAGESAQRAYAWLTAAERYEAALALTRDGGPSTAEHGWLLLRLAWLVRLTDPRRSLAHLEEALRVAADTGDRALAARAAYDHGLIGCQAGALRQGLAEMVAGAAALRDLPAADRARLDAHPAALAAPDETAGQGHLARFLAVGGRYVEAREAADRALAAPPGAPAGALGGVPRGAAQLALMVVHAAGGRPETAREAAAAARALYRASEHHFMVGGIAAEELRWVQLPYRADRPAERRDLAAEAEAAWARAEGAVPDLVPRLARLPELLLAGRWAEARQLMQGSRGAHGLYASRPSLLGQLAYLCGETDTARALVREAFPDGPATEPGDQPFLHALVLLRLAAALALDASDLPAARAWLWAHDRWLAWAGATLGQAEGQLGWAAYHRAVGDPAAAEDHARQGLARAGAPRQPLALLAAHRTLGEIIAAAGRYDEAEAHLRQALALADDCAAPYERALTLLALGELRAGVGEPGAAQPPVDEARALLAELGARPALARAEALALRLAAHAARPPIPASPEYPAGLTAREVEVLRLAATGRSNREVADALYLSVRTVERHIENIYRKIDAHSRADATAFALRHGLT